MCNIRLRAKHTDANEISAIVEIIEKDNNEIHVIANGVFYGAGIGGGKLGDSHAVTINGGKVYAEGGECGAGIGGGDCGDQIGAVIITGGTVSAYGFDGGAGIGGGDEDLLGNGGAGGKVIVGEDATVVAGTDKSEAMPIGNGEDDTNTLYGLTISNTARVRAGTSEKSAALQTKGNRISACHNRDNNWVKIEKCGHEGAEYTAIDTREHRVTCKHCYLDDTENHTIEGHICTKCGYGAYQATYDPANGTKPWVEYKEPETDEQGNLLPWVITLPEEPQAPEGKVFGGWFIDNNAEPEQYYAAGSDTV